MRELFLGMIPMKRAVAGRGNCRGRRVSRVGPRPIDQRRHDRHRRRFADARLSRAADRAEGSRHDRRRTLHERSDRRRQSFGIDRRASSFVALEGASLRESDQRCRSFCSFAATCSVASRTMTGRSSSPTRLLPWRPVAQARSTSRARLAGRFHRFAEAAALLDRALAAGYPSHEIDAERAALLQATGRYDEALELCASDWRKTIPGFTRSGRSRRCWRKWASGRAAREMLCGRARRG